MLTRVCVLLFFFPFPNLTNVSKHQTFLGLFVLLSPAVIQVFFAKALNICYLYLLGIIFTKWFCLWKTLQRCSVQKADLSYTNLEDNGRSTQDCE